MFPIIPADSAGGTGNEGLFGFGSNGGDQSITNKVFNAGVVSSDITGVGGATARAWVAACEYGGDKGIFGYGGPVGTPVSMTNLVSNLGVVSADVTGVGTSRSELAACDYGGDKGLFGYGCTSGYSDKSMTNKVSNVGVVATDTGGVGTARHGLAACEYGGDKGIFGFGYTSSHSPAMVGMTNLVSNTGVVATDTTGVGTARRDLAATQYGGD